MNIDEAWLHLTNTGTDWPNGNYRSTIASFTPNEESSQEKKEIELKIQLSAAEVRHLDDSELWTKFWWRASSGAQLRCDCGNKHKNIFW